MEVSSHKLVVIRNFLLATCTTCSRLFNCWGQTCFLEFFLQAFELVFVFLVGWTLFFFTSVEHGLHHCWTFDSIEIFLCIWRNHAIRIIRCNLKLEWKFLVEADVWIRLEVDVEGEFSHLTETLFQLEYSRVSILGRDLFNCDDVFLCLSINEDERPILLFDEGENFILLR